ncbi:LamG-like jellyroll fold domain-containing protein [Pontibacter litorisediminis]|uniref:LamG-like jellyroll fold domain-containing protein n=1 Tax=Pontibacter litorisediminis TaxID=1846260 RepID=UPI0023EAD741|nr:LamG-like jellyroll fold domain-containing protein [Pontibacter litorisediminis]
MNKLLPCLLTLFSVSLAFNCYAQGPKQALQLDGINDYVDFGEDNRGLTNTLTVEAWIKTSSLGHDHIISKYDRDAEKGFQLLIQNGKACIAGRDGSGNYRTSGYSYTIVADDNWHHLAGVVEDGTWMIYVDGVLEQKSETGYTRTILSSSEKLLIGNYYYRFLGNHFYSGQVDEVKLWKRALTVSEIRQNMCRSIPPDSPDLIGYFKLDSFTDGVIKDQSSKKIDGTLQNTSPSVAAVSSGAPIGDKSVYRYTSDWNAPLELVTDRANFSITKVDPAIQGLHLYTVQSPPASTSGINNSQEVKEYYGMFKVGEKSKKYKVYFKQYGLVCGSSLFRRQDNTYTHWSQVADTVASPIMLYTSSDNYGEFVATSNAPTAVHISGPTILCPGSTANLSVSNTGNGSIKWSNGATHTTTVVAAAGTYWVEVTSPNGCTSRDEITIASAPEPAAHFPAEAFICPGEPVVLDATTNGATYLWSDGQTTPSIKVSAPGVYSVAITTADCSYLKEAIVSSDECPVIPNIITPNGDGKNDAFTVQGVEAGTLELKVFNRWGKSVYQSDQYDNGWTAAGLSAGVYYYQFTSSRTRKVYKGWLEVMK